MTKKTKSILIVLIVVIVLSTIIIKSIPKLALKAETISPFEPLNNLQTGEEIPIKKGEILVASSNGKSFYLDTDDLTIRILDEKTKKEWSSKVKNPGNNKEKSIINITYIGKDDKKVEWDAYGISIEKGEYFINKLENGVRISLNFQTDNKKIEQLVPMYVTKEDYQNIFIEPLEMIKKQGKIDAKQYSSYKSILGSVFLGDLSGKGYKLSTGGVSPSGVKQLANFVEDIGYTEDMVRQGNLEAGIEVSIPQSASFKVVLDLILDNGDLVVNIPTYEIFASNEFYTIQTIEVLPNFGYSSSEVNKSGYIFVPDGAGGLFKLNSYDSTYPQYQRPIYNNTYFDKMYTMDTFKENVSMPVFGIMYGTDEKAQGMLGIIENGEELGTINTQLGTDNISSGGGVNNKVFSSVDVVQYSRVKLQGPYAEDSARYLVSIGNIDMDYTIRYKFFSENATYFEFANKYKEYLIEKYNLEVKYSDKPKIYLEVLGALTLVEHFLGVPYDKIVSMTTYEQLEEIINELKDLNLIIDYSGAFNDGESTSLMSKVNLVKENGAKNKIIDLINNSDKEILMGTNLMTIKSKTLDFNPKIHSIIGYNSKPAVIFKYNLMDGNFSPNGIGRKYLLNPKYFKDVTENFIKYTQDFKNIAINDVPNTFYANYNLKEIINPVQANEIIERELDNLKEEKVISLKNPNMNTLIYGDIAKDISRESSPYGTIYTSVPFRQLVMNGLVEYTTLNVNISKKDMNYYLLQALELGSYPKFIVSYKNEDILKDSQYTDIFNTHFEKIKPKIEELYDKYKNAFAKIGTTAIKNHTILQEGVFETTYQNGVKVITNYNLNEVNFENEVIGSMDFKIIE